MRIDKYERYRNYYPVSHHFYPILEHDEKTTECTKFIDSFKMSETNTGDNLIYIHIPFCNSICMFCPFHVSVTADKHKIYEEYVDYLIKEMELLSYKCKNISIKSIYFGGGSPSVLDSNQLEKLFKALNKFFDLEKDVEITFEGEARTLKNDEILDVLTANKVSRISYGVQTFNEDMRRLLKIGASLNDVYECQQALGKHKFKDINIDMMYYLPGQTIEDLDRDLKELVKFGADSFDYYYLSYYSFPENYFKKVLENKAPAKPKEEVRREMFRKIYKDMRLTEYKQKLESFFTRNNEVPEFFRILWGGGNGQGNANTIAIGASARGFFNNKAYANYTEIKDYYKCLDKGELPVQSVSEEVMPENRGMAFFSKFLEIEQNKVSSEYSDIFNKLLHYGLINKINGYYVITDEGLDWLPNIEMDFFTTHQRNLSDKIVEKLENHYSNKVTIYG